MEAFRNPSVHPPILLTPPSTKGNNMEFYRTSILLEHVENQEKANEQINRLLTQQVQHTYEIVEQSRRQEEKIEFLLTNQIQLNHTLLNILSEQVNTLSQYENAFENIRKDFAKQIEKQHEINHLLHQNLHELQRNIPDLLNAQKEEITNRIKQFGIQLEKIQNDLADRIKNHEEINERVQNTLLQLKRKMPDLLNEQKDEMMNLLKSTMNEQKDLLQEYLKETKEQENKNEWNNHFLVGDRIEVIFGHTSTKGIFLNAKNEVLFWLDENAKLQLTKINNIGIRKIE